MNIELQIRSSALSHITANAVEARLRTTCFAPIGPVYIDHADVANTSVEVFPANNTVRLQAPIDIFVVQRPDLLAAPNGAPAGATTPAGTVVVLLEMSMAGTTLSLRCVDADLGAFGAALGAGATAARAAIINAIGAAVSTDLGPALKQLGMTSPASSRIELVGDVVAIRFNPSGPAAGHLFAGQDWGLFLDGPAVEQLARSKVPKAMTEKLSSLVLNAHWLPVGTSPHVDIDYSGKAQVPDPFAGDVDGRFACDFSLTGPTMRTLRTTVHWSLRIDLGDFAPAFIEKAVREMIETGVFLSVVKTGGVPVGDHAFALDSVLREVKFSGARLNYSSLLASPGGMTVGGPVLWPVLPSRETLKPAVTKFGLPYRLEFCSILAKSGSGAPHWTATLDELTTTGRVWLEDGGTLCELEVVAPGNWLAQYATGLGAGDSAESGEIRFVVPSKVALGITDPVQVIVRTSRGVRLVDLGVPPAAKVDAQGNVTNAQLTYIDDCLYIPVGPEEPWKLNWGDPRDLLTNPVDWLDFAEPLNGLDIQLVNFFGLEPGELVQFRSSDHRVEVTADRNGLATVPVLLPLADQTGPAMLTRVNRQSIEGHFTVDSVIFQRKASLPAGLRSRLDSGVDGAARVTTEFGDRLEVHEIDRSGAPIAVTREQLSAPQLQLEELKQSPDRLPEQCAGLPGLIALHPVPGFADAGVAIAEMDDGTRLVLDLHGETVRVAGTFAGPIGKMDLGDDWALVAGGDRVTIYQVTRKPSERPPATGASQSGADLSKAKS